MTSNGDQMVQLRAKAAANEQENERRVVNWLGAIAITAIFGTVTLAANAARTEFGVDTAVIVALIGIVAQCASSLGTRRTRHEPTVPRPATDPAPKVTNVTFAPDPTVDDDQLGH